MSIGSGPTSLSSYSLMLRVLRGEAANTSFNVFCLTHRGIEPTTFRTQGEQANHYITKVVKTLKDLCLKQKQKMSQKVFNNVIYCRVWIRKYKLYMMVKMGNRFFCISWKFIINSLANKTFVERSFKGKFPCKMHDMM